MAGLEIKRGDFLYRDTLFVDLGEHKRHPRASASDLKELLLPKRSSTVTKDQVAHFYEAQLIHYGLPRTKDKNTAKVRLTNAITAKTLAVPGNIALMETEMRKEYARKVKGSARGVRDAVSASPKGKKRKANDSGVEATTTISVKVGDTTLEISQKTTAGSATTKKKVGGGSTPKKATPKPKAGITASVAKAQKPRASATRTAATTAPSGRAHSSAPSTPANPRPKQTAKRSRPMADGSAARNSSATARQLHDHAPVSFYESDSDAEMDDAPPAYESLDFNHDSDDYPSTNDASGIVQVTGSYAIYTPLVGSGTGSKLALRIDKASGTLWGQFSVDSKNGVLYMDNIAGLADQETVSFGWRAEDEETGDLRFGRGCNGSMELDSQGNVRGCFFALIRGQDVEFEGALQHLNAPDVAGLRSQWDRFPQIAYG